MAVSGRFGALCGLGQRQYRQPPQCPLFANARKWRATSVYEPEFYDFNLFDANDDAGTLADKALNDLSHTVFDT